MTSISLSAKSPSESATTVAHIMMPMDANVAGNVFGGSILRLIDEAASIVAYRHARKNIVTASIDRMDFFSPVFIGDLLRLTASINYVHNTSMEIGVRRSGESGLRPSQTYWNVFPNTRGARQEWQTYTRSTPQIGNRRRKATLV